MVLAGYRLRRTTSPAPATTPGKPSLGDPDSFVDGVPHDLLTQLRATEPVSWQDMEGEPGFCAVLRHADVVHVAREPNLFSASQGGVVLEDLEPDSLEMSRDMLLAMDPPRHTTYRRPSPTASRPGSSASSSPRSATSVAA